MTRESLGLRTGSYGSLQQQISPLLARKTSKVLLSSTREKERFLILFCRYFGRKKVAMLLLLVLALIVFVFGSFTISKENTNVNSTRLENMPAYEHTLLKDSGSPFFPVKVKNRSQHHLLPSDHASTARIFPHPCENFTIPPPPPTLRRLTGPRPCPVCYIPVEEALASMPSLPSKSPVIEKLTYARDDNPTTSESHQGSDFGGYPSLKKRNDFFDIKESMTVHCGFVKGKKPGQQSGFDIDEDDLMELEKFHDVIVASAIFGNYDLIQHPKKISAAARKNVPFFMFIDEETEAYMKNSSLLNSTKKVGLWRIIVVHNVPYADPRRNGKVPKLLLHRLFPNVRFSLWIDGKLELVVDPYKILERFLWGQNATFAISRHYKRFDVFEEAEANKAAGKYSNSSIDEQIDFYVSEGLTPYSTAKLPITSDVPEGCVIIREHIPITNLFTCLWFNEVDRFTSRDQLSFSTVRDKIMARVGWSVNMFLDCERRNFVIQSYHRELLENIPPPPPPVIHLRPRALDAGNIAVKTPTVKKNPPKRGRGDKKPGSRRRRKVVAGSRDKIPF